MEFLNSFLRRHFTGKPVVAFQTVSWFLRNQSCCVIYIMQPHVAVFLNVFSFSFLSANEGISSYECFKYPWKFVGGSAWNTSLLRSAGIDPLQITFRVFVNIDSWCPSLQSFHSDVSSLFYMSVFTQRACFGRLWETCESMKTWV